MPRAKSGATVEIVPIEPNIELRRYQAFPRMSDDSNAFVAEVWVDNAKACDVKDDGRGGCLEVQTYKCDDKAYEKLEAVIAKQPQANLGEGMKVKVDIDLFVNGLIDSFEELKWARKQIAKGFLYVVDGGGGKWFAYVDKNQCTEAMKRKRNAPKKLRVILDETKNPVLKAQADAEKKRREANRESDNVRKILAWGNKKNYWVIYSFSKPRSKKTWYRGFHDPLGEECKFFVKTTPSAKMFHDCYADENRNTQSNGHSIDVWCNCGNIIQAG